MRRHEIMVVVRRGDQFLVLERSPARGGYWNLVAGGVEAGEDTAAAATRELQEETALEVTVTPLDLDLEYDGPTGTVRLDAFLAEAPDAWEPVLDEEHVAYRWCGSTEAVELLAYDEPRAAVRAAEAR